MVLGAPSPHRPWGLLRLMTNKEKYLEKLAKLAKLKKTNFMFDQAILDLIDELGNIYQLLSEKEIEEILLESKT